MPKRRTSLGRFVAPLVPPSSPIVVVLMAVEIADVGEGVFNLKKIVRNMKKRMKKIKYHMPKRRRTTSLERFVAPLISPSSSK
jgi:hypothetical protein